MNNIDIGILVIEKRPCNNGDLVPYDQMWRTGANKNPMLTTDDIMILVMTRFNQEHMLFLPNLERQSLGGIYLH